MAPVVTLPIVHVRPATPRSRIVRIGAPDLSFAFRAGQAIAIATHGQAERRPYSIASAPEDTARDRAIELLVRVGSAGSPGPHLEPLEPGVLVDVEGPIGKFLLPDQPEASHFLFIAGGSGISPLRSMMRHALAVGTERRHAPTIGLIYSARTQDEFAYLGEFEHLAAAGAISLMLTVTRSDTAERWSGSRGRISLSHLREMVPHDDTLCFICGPQTLVDDIKPLLKEVGLDDQKIRMEEW